MGIMGARGHGFSSVGIKVTRADGRVHDFGEWSHKSENWCDQICWYRDNWKRLAFWNVINFLEATAIRCISISNRLVREKERKETGV